MINLKEEFLNKYTLDNKKTVKIINNDDVSKMTVCDIPENWMMAFKEEKEEKRIEVILNLWQKYVGKELSNTISFLRENLIKLELMEIGGKYSLLYSVRSSNGKILYYEGKNPKDRISNKNLEREWMYIPDKIREFYNNVHSGFYYYPSKTMGLNSYENIFKLDEYEWGILDELDEVEINMDSSYAFFSNGMGMYVVIDYTNYEDNTSILWSSKEEPEYNIDFWDIVDEWIVIGFE